MVGIKMQNLLESCVGTSPLSVPVSYRSRPLAHVKHTGPNIVGMQPLAYNIRKGELQIATATFQSRPPRVKCATAINATSAAGATQTIARKSRTITVTSDKVKTPKLDDNGPGLPPRNDDGNGGNGGGGGGNWSGGLALLGVLGILDILKEIEAEWQRKEKRILLA